MLNPDGTVITPTIGKQGALHGMNTTVLRSLHTQPATIYSERMTKDENMMSDNK